MGDAARRSSFVYDLTRDKLTDVEVDDCLSDIDWEAMLDEEENDGPEAYVFDSGNYASEQEATAALHALLVKAMEAGIRAARENPTDSPRR
jgi:hypothetical protein